LEPAEWHQAARLALIGWKYRPDQACRAARARRVGRFACAVAAAASSYRRSFRACPVAAWSAWCYRTVPSPALRGRAPCETAIECCRNRPPDRERSNVAQNHCPVFAEVSHQALTYCDIVGDAFKVKISDVEKPQTDGSKSTRASSTVPQASVAILQCSHQRQRPIEKWLCPGQVGPGPEITSITCQRPSSVKISLPSNRLSAGPQPLRHWTSLGGSGSIEAI